MAFTELRLKSCCEDGPDTLIRVTPDNAEERARGAAPRGVLWL